MIVHEIAGDGFPPPVGRLPTPPSRQPSRIDATLP